MGREIKRVPLDFDWPLEKPWQGFTSPDDGTVPCKACVYEYGSSPNGYSRLGNAIYEARHTLASNVADLTPEETRFLKALESKAAPAFRKKRKDRAPYGGFIGDIDNGFVMYDVMKHLAKTLGVSYKKTFLCPECGGKCRVVADPVQNKKAKAWRSKEPPKGEGWQVWETVSEGSPITPVFATADELIEHLCTVGTTWDQSSIARGWQKGLPTREQATAFVKAGWVPSAVITTNSDGTRTLHKNIESAPLMQGDAE